MVAQTGEQVAIITGASSGIGRACAIAMDAVGIRLVIVGRDRERLASVVPSLSREPLIVHGDVADSETSTRARDAAIERWGRLDILIANAGLYSPDHGWDMPAERVDSIVTTNVLGVMHCVHAVIPTFIGQGTGDIIVTSTHSHRSA